VCVHVLSPRPRSAPARMHTSRLTRFLPHRVCRCSSFCKVRRASRSEVAGKGIARRVDMCGRRARRAARQPGCRLLPVAAVARSPSVEQPTPSGAPRATRSRGIDRRARRAVSGAGRVGRRLPRALARAVPVLLGVWGRCGAADRVPSQRRRREAPMRTGWEAADSPAAESRARAGLACSSTW